MYRGETCEDCGFPVAFFVRSYWVADDNLWNEVIGTEDNPRGEGVVLCPPCFTSRAHESGQHVHWRAAASVPASRRHGRGCPCTPCQAEDWDAIDAGLKAHAPASEPEQRVRDGEERPGADWEAIP